MKIFQYKFNNWGYVYSKFGLLFTLHYMTLVITVRIYHNCQDHLLKNLMRIKIKLLKSFILVPFNISRTNYIMLKLTSLISWTLLIKLKNYEFRSLDLNLVFHFVNKVHFFLLTFLKVGKIILINVFKWKRMKIVWSNNCLKLELYLFW